MALSVNIYIAIILILSAVGLVVLYFIKKKKIKLPKLTKDNIGDHFHTEGKTPKTKIKSRGRFIPIRIIKQRGKAVLIEHARGKFAKSNKESEMMRLKLSNKKELDSFDFSKLNPDGSLTLVEKKDGALVYAEVEDDKVGSTGEGVLRDGYFLNQDWIDKSFPEQMGRLNKLLPALMFGIFLISIAITSYLTYNYWSEMTGTISGTQDAMAESYEKALDSMNKIARSQEMASENMRIIAQHLATANANAGG